MLHNHYNLEYTIIFLRLKGLYRQTSATIENHEKIFYIPWINKYGIWIIN